MGNWLNYKTYYMKTIAFLVFFQMLIACNSGTKTIKFLGEWQQLSDSFIHCKISKSGNNFILEYTQLENWEKINDYTRQLNKAFKEIMPVFYDKSKDKLIVKWKKNLDAIYDENTNQLIFESWGAFKKIE